MDPKRLFPEYSDRKFNLHNQTLPKRPNHRVVAIYQLDNPVYINPGEFVQLVTQHFGTVGTTGTVAHIVTLDYSWE